jgi:hypothetical protein
VTLQSRQRNAGVDQSIPDFIQLGFILQVVFFFFIHISHFFYPRYDVLIVLWSVPWQQSQGELRVVGSAGHAYGRHGSVLVISPCHCQPICVFNTPE